MFKFLRNTLPPVVGLLVGFGLYLGLTAINPDYEVTKMTGVVLDVEPVGHRNSTGYVTKIRVDGKVIYKEFRSPPSSERITLYSYYDPYNNGGEHTYSGSDPNVSNTIPQSLIVAIALIGAAAAYIVSEGSARQKAKYRQQEELRASKRLRRHHSLGSGRGQPPRGYTPLDRLAE